MKIIMIFVLSVMLTYVKPISIFTNVNYDSIHIENEEASQFKQKEDDVVIKLYGGGFMHSFAERKKIADILTDELCNYLVISESEIIYKTYRNNEVVTIFPTTDSSDWREFYKYAISPNRVFDESVKIYNVYCLNGAPSYDGAYIYYVTSEGDFVLYKEFLTDEEEYLFPIDVFYQFAEKVQADKMLYEDYDGVGTASDELFDLASYKLGVYEIKDSGDNGLLLGVAVAGVGAIICFILLKMRKKEKN